MGVKLIFKAIVFGGTVSSLTYIFYNVARHYLTRSTQNPTTKEATKLRKMNLKSNLHPDNRGKDFGPYFDAENGVESSTLSRRQLQFYETSKRTSDNETDCYRN